MPDPKLSFGHVGHDDYIIVQLVDSLDDTVVIDSQPFGPAPPPQLNVQFFNVPPGVYIFKFWDSLNGITTTSFITSYTVDVVTNEIISQTVQYTVGGGGDHDPAPGDVQIIDPDLDGKTIDYFKEGKNFLRPGIDFITLSGGGVELINGDSYSLNEVVTLIVKYPQPQTSSTAAGLFSGYAVITSDTTITSGNANMLTRCEGAGARLVITLPELSTIPNHRFYYFTSHAGSQIQTKFVTQNDETIAFQGNLLEEIVIGKGEVLWLEKNGSRYEVINDCPGISNVGQRFASRMLNVPNTLPEDGATVYNGDDYPRFYNWLINVLPIESRVVILDSAMNTYVPAAGKEALPVTCSDSKRFRTGNMRGLSEKAMYSFTSFGGVSERVYNYPGGLENEMIGEHIHESIYGNTASHGGASDALSGVFKWLVGLSNTGSGVVQNSRTGYVSPVSGTRTNKVKNAGFISLIRV